jgi:hypothetical protein
MVDELRMRILRTIHFLYDLDSFHLRQALEGEYPKLLKLQNDIINRLNQLHNGFSELEMNAIDEDTYNDGEQINEKQKFVIYVNCM